MNFNKTKNLITLSILTILLFSTFSVYEKLSASQKEQDITFDLSGYVTSDSLYIENDIDLAANSSSGIGSAGDPYVIENLSIVTSDSIGIYIAFTTKNFVIRDCFIDAVLYGIYIYNAAAGTVEIDNNTLYHNEGGIGVISTDSTNVTNNYCDDNDKGIYIDSLDDGIVKNNTCINGIIGIHGLLADYVTYVENKLYSNSENGLQLDSCDSCNITENKCYSNTRDGIYLSLSLLNSLTHNEVYLNGYNGIYINQGSFNTLENNYVHNNNRDGIKISYAASTTITNNTLYDNDWYGINNLYATSTSILDNNATKDGFGIFAGNQGDYDGLTVSGNTVNGKPLGYLNGLGSEVGLTPNIFGQLILAFCNGTVVEDYTIADTSIALAMIGCENVTVDNCNFDNNNYGSIRLDNSIETTIQNSKCSYNEEYGGFYSFGATNTTLYNITTDYNQFGIYLSGATVFNISHSSSSFNSWYNTRFQGCVAGNIRYNVIYSSANDGMLLYNCDYTNISHNSFEDNLDYAIYSTDDSWHNWIHHNAFIGNNPGGTSQAYEESVFNMWDDPWNMEGNYWDDYSGSGDYILDGIGNANDSYPLGDIPPGVIISEFNQFSLLIFLLPIVFVSIIVIRKRK